MKTKILNLGFFLICIISISGCKGPSIPGILIIRTHGVEAVYNISKTGGLFGSGSFSGRTSGVATEDGDMLAVLVQKNPDMIIFQYSSKMSKDLNFNYDTLKPFLLYRNNAVFAVQLKDSASWNFIKSAKHESLAGINSIAFSLPVKNKEYGILSELSHIAPAAGLVIETRSDLTDLNKVLSMFQPASLSLTIDSAWFLSDSLLRKLDKIQTIFVSRMPENFTHKNDLSMLKNLRQMIVGFDKETDHAIDFRRYRYIISLGLSCSGDTNTSVINTPENLQSLFFINCGSLKDIHNLNRNKYLHSLGFTGCEKLLDISAVYGMKNLQWLSCPSSITQAQFDTLIPSLPDLQVLELITCDSLKNIDAVRKLKDLRSLTLDCAKIDTSAIPDMKNLELLVFKEKASEKEILTLSNRFPNTLVVPGKGLCLGSGWILLLLPLVFVGLIILKKY